MPFKAHAPYNDLPKLPPKVILETSRVLKKVTAARSSLGELKGIGKLLPSQRLLLNTLILEEARNSSEIENIITSHDSLYRALVLGSKNFLISSQKPEF